MNILLLAAANRITFAEMLLKSRKDIKLFSAGIEDHEPIEKVSKYIRIDCNYNRPLSLFCNNEFYDIHKIISTYKIDIVIPLTDPMTLIASQLKKVYVPGSNYEICDLFYDKRKSNKWFIDHNILVPATDNFILKPIRGSASRGIELFPENPDYIIQEKINGIEWSVDCFVAKTGQRYFATRIRKKILGGEVIESKIEENLELTRICYEIMKTGIFYGALNIQFIERNGKYYCIEINPRFGGGCTLSIAAGLNFFEIMFNDYFNKNQQIYKIKNLSMKRCLQEVYFEDNC